MVAITTSSHLCSELVELYGSDTVVDARDDLLCNLNNIDVLGIQSPAQLGYPAESQSVRRVSTTEYPPSLQPTHLEVILSNATRSLRPLRLKTYAILLALLL